ncbi:MAG: cupin domain-containing protein [Desulfobacteraceae bacterium]|nr:cupin domain-containing protein [Desulfobacteraceae bacterium]
MNEEWKYHKLGDIRLSDMGNGFFGSNLVELDGFELTFVKANEGSGHDSHQHEDLSEILIFLEGECSFTVGGTELNIKGGSLLHIPPGVDHKVKYEGKSKVFRIKIPKSRG